MSETLENELSLHPSMDSRRTTSTSSQDAAPIDHPFASSTSRLEILHPVTASGIDVEEEARLYEELCEAYENDVRNFDAESRHSYHGGRSAPESVFSADIFLADNTGSGSFAKDVSISGWTTVAGDKVPSMEGKSMKGLGAGAYVVYDCVITTREATTFHVLKRYSSFEELDHVLRVTLPRNLRPALPTLPPKAPFAKFRPAFLDKRRQHLQIWLARVLLHPEIGQSEAVKRWVIS